MKEGYLQEKIRELDYKLKQQMELAGFLQKELQRLEGSKKQQKAIIKKLDSLDQFKTTFLADLKKENDNILKNGIHTSSKEILHQVEASIDKKLREMKTYVDNSLKILREEQDLGEAVSELTYSLNETRHLLQLALETLVQERIISQERITIITKRASLRASKEKKETNPK